MAAAKFEVETDGRVDGQWLTEPEVDLTTSLWHWTKDRNGLPCQQPIAHIVKSVAVFHLHRIELSGHNRDRLEQAKRHLHPTRVPGEEFRSSCQFARRDVRVQRVTQNVTRRARRLRRYAHQREKLSLVFVRDAIQLIDVLLGDPR